MPTYQFNPVAQNDPNLTYPLVLTEPQWKAAVAQYFSDASAIEQQCMNGIDSEFVRTVDGDFWIGSAPGSFTPPLSRAATGTELTGASEGGDEPEG